MSDIIKGAHDINVPSEVRMAAVTVRNLPDDVHRALKARAKRNGRSAEAEIRLILAEAVRPEDRVGLGTRITLEAPRHGPLDVPKARDDLPEPADFS